MNLEQIFEKQVIYHCTTNFRSNYQYSLKKMISLKSQIFQMAANVANIKV